MNDVRRRGTGYCDPSSAAIDGQASADNTGSSIVLKPNQHVTTPAHSPGKITLEVNTNGDDTFGDIAGLCNTLRLFSSFFPRIMRYIFTLLKFINNSENEKKKH